MRVAVARPDHLLDRGPEAPWIVDCRRAAGLAHDMAADSRRSGAADAARVVYVELDRYLSLWRARFADGAAVDPVEFLAERATVLALTCELDSLVLGDDCTGGAL